MEEQLQMVGGIVSEDRLVSLYSQGVISRKTFIRRLVGLGMSVGAAVAYSQAIAPDAWAQVGSQNVGISDLYYEEDCRTRRKRIEDEFRAARDEARANDDKAALHAARERFKSEIAAWRADCKGRRRR